MEICKIVQETDRKDLLKLIVDNELTFKYNDISNIKKNTKEELIQNKLNKNKDLKYEELINIIKDDYNTLIDYLFYDIFYYVCHPNLVEKVLGDNLKNTIKEMGMFTTPKPIYGFDIDLFKFVKVCNKFKNLFTSNFFEGVDDISNISLKEWDTYSLFFKLDKEFIMKYEDHINFSLLSYNSFIEWDNELLTRYALVLNIDGIRVNGFINTDIFFIPKMINE